MRVRKGFVVSLVALIASNALCAFAAEAITVDSLLDDMVNLAALAEFPDPPFTCRQFSSYDRRSKTPDDHDAWFANMDRNQYLRTETREGRTEFVMMDAEGPGCIVRIWSANAAGTLRIYLDGAERPALEMDMQHLMDGNHTPFLAPLAGVRSRGWNLYFPLPYAKRCKVTATNGELYYHVNYRTYPAGTPVESFSPAAIETLREKIDRVRRLLSRPYVSNLPPEDASIRRIGLTRLAPGATRTVADLKGPAAVFELGAALDAGDWDRMLRHTILQIAFDGEKPAVLCPLGDFFGTGPGANSYESLPLSVHPSGELRSKWFMPFRTSCRITLVNAGDTAVDFRGAVTTVPYRWADRSMHFHAKWRSDNDIPTRPFRDWTFLRCKGEGVFVGCMLSLVNPVKNWWGEGDEKIYVDGETFPSTFGTGTEDYFGYAWGDNRTFQHAYHNQTRCDGPGRFGRTSLNRFHILDKIPFTRQFQFDMEVWHWHETSVMSYNATSCWYARPGGDDFFEALSKDALEVIEPPPLPQPRKIKGAIEGEGLRVVRKTGGQPQVQGGFGDLWSGERQLWWPWGNPKDELVVAFPVNEAGRYNVLGNFTRAHDYGIIQLYINDKKAGEPMDFYVAEGVKITGEKPLGVYDLRKGENQLKAVIVGKNPKAAVGYMFGIDYLLLEKRP